MNLIFKESTYPYLQLILLFPMGGTKRGTNSNILLSPLINKGVPEIIQLTPAHHTRGTNFLCPPFLCPRGPVSAGFSVLPCGCGGSIPLVFALRERILSFFSVALWTCPQAGSSIHAGSSVWVGPCQWLLAEHRGVELVKSRLQADTSRLGVQTELTQPTHCCPSMDRRGRLAWSVKSHSRMSAIGRSACLRSQKWTKVRAFKI